MAGEHMHKLSLAFSLKAPRSLTHAHTANTPVVISTTFSELSSDAMDSAGSKVEKWKKKISVAIDFDSVSHCSAEE